MRHAPLFLAVALSAVTAFGARTEAASPVVVELFTSQGCSSCPPADEILGDLAMRPDVLALSLNVDYWDYLGWKDTLALPGNAVRQRQYVAGWGGRTVYTPQMVIGGAVDVVGNKRRAVESALQKLAATPAAAEIRLSRTADGAVTAQISATGASAKPAVVWMVGYDDHVDQPIGRGENSGRAIRYFNVVREWKKAGDWDGASDAAFTLPAPLGAHVAVIVQDGEAGPILGAARL